MTSVTAALKKWEADHGERLEDARVVKLYCQIPPIQKLEPSLNSLKSCEQLSLSTNCITHMIPLGGMKALRILSLGRNNLKRIEKLEEVADTLEELWVSYNNITSLDGVMPLRNLTTLYISNNKIKEWEELAKLSGLERLHDVLFVGNPIYEGLSREEARIQVLRRLPQVVKIDGDVVSPAEREQAAA